MITSLLSIAQGAATSAEFTVPAGVVDRVFLVDADGDGVPFRSEATVQRKGSGNQFQSEAWLDFWHPSAEIQGPGTFRVVRGAGVAVGVDRDNGTSSALLVGANGLTLGGQALTASQKAQARDGLRVGSGVAASKRAVSLNQNPLAVMASPPAITLTDEGQVAWTGSSLAVSGRLCSTNNTGVAGAPASFSVFRASYPTMLGGSYPNYFYTKFNTAEDLVGQYINNTISIAFSHTGSKFALAFKGQTGHIAVKVNGQWASLTPTTIANDGALRILLVDFGSSATRQVEVLAYNLAPRGVWVDATDSISPAAARGPRVCVIGDSFGAGSGNEVSPLFSWVTYMAEYLGWDDVISIAAGSTGLVSDNGGAKKRYIDRLARDVIPLSPDIVIVQPSTNDNAQTPAAIVAAAQAVYAALSAYCAVVFTSPSISGGAGAIVSANSLRLQSNVLKAWCASVGIGFIDWIEQPLNSAMATPHTANLTSSPAAGATSFTTSAQLIPGATYKFPDGAACYVRSIGGGGGLTATVDKVPTAQTSGAAITQCGSCVFTGTGRVGAPAGWGNADLCIGVGADVTHPSNLGHRLLGEVAARQIAAMEI